jgi:hypothetical protein
VKNMKKEDPPENAVSRLDFSEDFSSDPSASVPEDRGDTGMAAISFAFARHGRRKKCS